MQVVTPYRVSQLGSTRAKEIFGLTDADLDALPYTIGNGHHSAGRIYLTRHLQRAEMFKAFRTRGQTVIYVERRDIKRSEFLFVPVDLAATTIGAIKAMMPGDVNVLGHPRLAYRPLLERRAHDFGHHWKEPEYGRAVRLHEHGADGTAKTIGDFGIPNEALLELFRSEQAVDREPTLEQRQAAAQREANRQAAARQEAARREEVIAESRRREEARRASEEATREAEQVARTSFWAEELAKEGAKMAREAEKRAAKEAKQQAQAQAQRNKGKENGRQAAKAAKAEATLALLRGRPVASAKGCRVTVVYEEAAGRAEYAGLVLHYDAAKGLLVRFDGYSVGDPEGEAWVDEGKGDEWEWEVPEAPKRQRV